MKNDQWAEYEAFVAQHAKYNGKERLPYIGFPMSALGLVGEAGEVADHIKKAFYHHQDDALNELDSRREALFYELGDVMWYLTDLARRLGFTLAEVRDGNIEKLSKRYSSGGFTPEEADAKADGK